MIMSVILAIFVAFFVGMAESLFVNDKPLFAKVEDANGKSTRTTLSDEGWMKTGIIAALVFFANWLSPKLGGYEWVAVILLAVMVGIYGYLAYWWKQEGSSLKEMVPFLFLMALLFFTFKSVVSVVTGLSQSGLLTSILMMLPTFFTIASIGFYVVSLLFYERDEANEDEDENRAKNLNIFGWIAAIIFALLLVGCFFSFCWGALNLSSETEESGWVFHNSMLQEDEIKENNYDFGPDLLTKLKLDTVSEFETKKAEAEAEGKTALRYSDERLAAALQEIEETEYKAEDYDKDLRERMEVDPPLGVAIMVYTDMVTGTDFFWEYYEKYPDDIMMAMNYAVDDFMANPEKYKEYLEAFFERLDETEVSLKDGKGITDQMYQNPYTKDGVPEIVVFETTQKEGTFLVYHFNIKGNDVPVMLRIECGYQPTNVAELFDLIPGTNPNKPAPTPTTPTPTPPPPTPTPPSNPKDPSKGTQGPIVGPNDDPGPGPDTNNGVGAQYSSEQTPDGSIFLDDYEEYEEIMDELEEINDSQLEGGDPNTPTYTPPAEVYDPDGEGINVDNNGDTGTGYGGIDVSTPITPPAETVDGEDVTEPGAGDSWGGPPDA